MILVKHEKDAERKAQWVRTVDFAIPDLTQQSDDLAAFIALAQKDSIDKKDRFTIALSGGSLSNMPKGLISNPFMKWDKGQVYCVDECIVPLDHADYNHRAYTDALFAHVPIPTENIHTIDPTLFGDLDELSDSYEKLLIREFSGKGNERFPVFDLILLGVGPDGHTASLFPSHELLAETDRWVAYLEDSPKPPLRRITFTYPVINHAARVVFVASGDDMAATVADVLDCPEKGVPAALVRPVLPGQLYWFVDDPAASKTTYPGTSFDQIICR
ncbi:6-phosphogluconolactonase [Pholiota conissans]|uniref:Multifunctional fusion protein n=1 Tax=Pholiota conissans TaxID=109636 RepID=A0A9P5YJP4_9AGAR|nr:6-phosphogluconolactonase [Pholiota conissans]